MRNAVEDGVLFMDLRLGSHTQDGGRKLVFLVLRNIFKMFCAFQSKSEKKICMGIWQRGGCRSQ